MKIVHPLPLSSKEEVHVSLEYHRATDDVYFEIEGANFDADFVMPRRQCREMRDWLNIVLDD